MKRWQAGVAGAGRLSLQGRRRQGRHAGALHSKHWQAITIGGALPAGVGACRQRAAGKGDNISEIGMALSVMHSSRLTQGRPPSCATGGRGRGCAQPTDSIAPVARHTGAPLSITSSSPSPSSVFIFSTITYEEFLV